MSDDKNKNGGQGNPADSTTNYPSCAEGEAGTGNAKTQISEDVGEPPGSDEGQTTYDKTDMKAAVDASAKSISQLQENLRDPVTGAVVREMIYKGEKFVVYLDDELRIQYRGDWTFPQGSEPIRFEVSRLESLTLGNRSFFGMKPDEDQLLAMRRVLAEVIASLSKDPDLVRAQANLAIVSQTITGIVSDNTRLKRVVASVFVTALVCGIGWWWIRAHPTPPGINIENEFALWASLGALGALLFNFTRMHSVEVRPFSSNWLVFWEAAARVLTGGIGAVLLVAAAKAQLLIGALSQTTSSNTGFWGIFVVSLLAGASERLVPDFIARTGGAGNPGPQAGSSPGQANSPPQKPS